MPPGSGKHKVPIFSACEKCATLKEGLILFVVNCAIVSRFSTKMALANLEEHKIIYNFICRKFRFKQFLCK